MAQETILQMLDKVASNVAGGSDKFAENMERLADNAEALADQANTLAAHAQVLTVQSGAAGGGNEFIFLFTIFVLAILVGYYVVWNVTPALHSPLMGDQRDLVGHYRRCADRRGSRRYEPFEVPRFYRRGPGFGQYLRRLHRHAAHAANVQEKEIAEVG